MNKGPSVGKVPGDGATFFFAASDPAMARIGIAWANRPKNIATPVVTLYQGLLALRPAKAEPGLARSLRNPFPRLVPRGNGHFPSLRDNSAKVCHCKESQPDLICPIGGCPRVLGRLPGLAERFRSFRFNQLLMRPRSNSEVFARHCCRKKRLRLLRQLQRHLVGDDLARARELRDEVTHCAGKIIERCEDVDCVLLPPILRVIGA